MTTPLSAMSLEQLADVFYGVKVYGGVPCANDIRIELRRRDERERRLRDAAAELAQAAEDAGWHKSTTESLRAALAEYKETTDAT